MQLIAIALMNHAQEKEYVVIVCVIICGTGNSPAAASRKMPKEHITGHLSIL
jgi:hypothetical protein